MTLPTDPVSVRSPRPSFAVGQAMAVLYLWLFLCAPSVAHETAPRYGVPLKSTTIAAIDFDLAWTDPIPYDIALAKDGRIFVLCATEQGNHTATLFVGGQDGFSPIYTTEKCGKTFQSGVLLFSQEGKDYWANFPAEEVGLDADLKLGIGLIPDSKDQAPRYEWRGAFPTPGYRRSAPLLPEHRADAAYRLKGFIPLVAPNEYLVIGSFDEFRWGPATWMGDAPCFSKLCSVRIRNGAFEKPERIDARGAWESGAFSVLSKADGSLRMAERRLGYPHKDQSSICILEQPKGGKWSKPEVVAIGRREPPSKEYGDCYSTLGDTCAGLHLGLCGNEEVLLWGAVGKLNLSQKRAGQWDENALARLPSEHSVSVLDGRANNGDGICVLFRAWEGGLFLIAGDSGKWHQPLHIAGEPGKTRVARARMRCAPNGDTHIVFVEAPVDSRHGEVKYMRVPAEVWKE